jgi:hypothetical protein
MKKIVTVWSSWRYFSAKKLSAVVRIMKQERITWISGLAERSEGLSAKGHTASALNTTCPAKRSHTTCGTGTSLMAPRYFAVASSVAKQSVAKLIRPMAFSRWLGSALAVGAGREVIGERLCAPIFA